MRTQTIITVDRVTLHRQWKIVSHIQQILHGAAKRFWGIHQSNCHLDDTRALGYFLHAKFLCRKDSLFLKIFYLIL